MRPILHFVLLSTAVLSLGSSSLAQSLITVDAAQGPGFDFADIPPAVAAASEGDVLLVRPGTYDNLIINGKSLTVVGQGPVEPNIEGGSVRNLGVFQGVTLIGLQFTSADEAALQIKNNTGPVLVEDCLVTGGWGTYETAATIHGRPAAEVVNSAKVAFSGSTMTGGNGANYSTVAIITIGNGAASCAITGPAKVAFYGCTLEGGNGGNSEFDEAEWGGYGASAIACNSTELTVVGCTLVGGHGGAGGDDDGGIWGGSTCGGGGNGGNGIYATLDGPAPQSPIHLADNSITPGAPGFGGLGCPDGTPGLDYDVATLPLTQLGIPFAKLESNSPIPETMPLTLSATAPPGTGLSLGVSAGSDFQFSPALSGVALLDLATTQVLSLGTADASGNYSLTLPGLLSVPAGMALNFRTQLVGIDAITSGVFLGGPATLIIADA